MNCYIFIIKVNLPINLPNSIFTQIQFPQPSQLFQEIQFNYVII